MTVSPLSPEEEAAARREELARAMASREEEALVAADMLADGVEEDVAGMNDTYAVSGARPKAWERAGGSGRLQRKACDGSDEDDDEDDEEPLLEGGGSFLDMLQQ